jgi:hypothetical protein
MTRPIVLVSRYPLHARRLKRNCHIIFGTCNIRDDPNFLLYYRSRLDATNLLMRLVPHRSQTEHNTAGGSSSHAALRQILGSFKTCDLELLVRTASLRTTSPPHFYLRPQAQSLSDIIRFWKQRTHIFHGTFIRGTKNAL